ncbi:MAG: hypothetical protein QG633_147 [Patescibacteria group bacterium]|nr:hypothetical protein [Patescibacteria group bacterium]
MLKRILMFIAVLVVFMAASANAAGVQTKIPNMPKISRGDWIMEIPVTKDAVLLSKSAVETMSGDVVEFPAALFPDIWMYSSGYAVYVAASGPFPPADSGIEFGQKVVVDVTSPITGEFKYANTIPVGQQIAHDRWWFDAHTSDRFDVNAKAGDLLSAGTHTFRVKVPYKVGESNVTLVYDFQYEVGEFVFWTMACQSSDGRVGLDLFVKALPSVAVVPGETQVDFLVDSWSSGFGTLGTSVYSTDEWPWYASVSLASAAEYEHVLLGTQRDITLNILGRQVTLAQEFFAPYDFLTVCETGGGKGKQ